MLKHGDKVFPVPVLKAEQPLFSQPFPHMTGFPSLWPFSWTSPASPHLFCIAGTKTKHSIPNVAQKSLSRAGWLLLYLWWWCPFSFDPASCWLSFTEQLTVHSHWICCPPEHWTFFTELLPRPVDPSLCCTSGLCFPRLKNLHLSLLNFIRFLVFSKSVHSYQSLLQWNEAES